MLRLFYLQILMVLFSAPSITAQPWQLAKEKDGIRIYTRKEPGKSVKSFKGVAEIKAPAAKIFAMLEDVNHTEWWDKNISTMKVLGYEKNRSARYYIIYDLPWPVTDRDLCVDVKVDYNPATGAGTIAASPLPSAVPASKSHVRIVDYRQTWTVKPLTADLTHVELEGIADPAGSIPDWIVNSIVVDSPLQVIGDVKKQMER